MPTSQPGTVGADLPSTPVPYHFLRAGHLLVISGGSTAASGHGARAPSSSPYHRTVTAGGQ